MTGPTPAASVPPDAGGRPPLHRYELSVRTVVAPALVAAFPVQAERIVVPRRTIRRLQIIGDRDVGSVLQRLAECGVDVVELRVVDGAA